MKERAEIGLFGPVEIVGVVGQVGDLAVPHSEREGFQMAEDEARHQFQRMGRMGPVIIDEDHLAAGRHAPEQRVNDSALVVVR